jgi:hypothetical protein
MRVGLQSKSNSLPRRGVDMMSEASIWNWFRMVGQKMASVIYVIGVLA